MFAVLWFNRCLPWCVAAGVIRQVVTSNDSGENNSKLMVKHVTKLWNYRFVVKYAILLLNIKRKKVKIKESQHHYTLFIKVEGLYSWILAYVKITAR